MLRTLGKKRQAISSFMREDIDKKSAFILFDGHRLITSFQDDALCWTRLWLQALRPQNLMEIHSEIPEMGTVTIRTNRADLNCMQVYRVYK